MTDEILAALDEALGLGETRVIVRSRAAIAEVAGGRLRRGDEWVTLGDEGPGGSHVHLKMADVGGLRYSQAEGRNAALDVLDPDGTVLLSVSFRKTNPGRAETFDRERLATVEARFSRFAEMRA